MGKIFYFIHVILALVGCATSECSQDTTDEKAEAVMVMTSKEYVDNNIFIDVDCEALSAQLKNNEDGRAIENNREDFEMMKAALYRFYRRVYVADNKYVCSAKSSSEINVSQRLYDFMAEGLEKMNENWIELHQKGYSYNLQGPSEKYLESLLR